MHGVASPGLGHRAEAFSLHVNAGGDDIPSIVQRGFFRHEDWDAAHAIVEHFEGATHTIALHGEAWYELAIDIKHREFRLLPVLPNTLRVLSSLSLQMLHDDRGGVRFVRIPRQSLRRVTAPGIKSRRWRAMVRRLLALERALWPNWATENITRQTVPYRSTEHQRAVSNQMLATTNLIEYPMRNFGEQQGVSPLLLAFRWLRFHAFCARFRVGLLDDANEALRIIGNALDFDARITMRPLPAGDEWELAAQSLLEGADPDEVVPYMRAREDGTL